MERPTLLLIDKPQGISSFSVIRELRRRTGIRKFGHAGTLDPLATGLLLIGVEEGTKSLTALVGLDKEYLATVLLGEQRTTGDQEGRVLVERAYADDCPPDRLGAVVSGLVGEHLLPVSAYSAVKRNGVPLYKRARQAERRGECVTDVPSKRMVVHEAEFLTATQSPHHPHRLLVTVRFLVSSGTYIRSLAEELGRRLGYPACLLDLRRTQVGPYSVADALKLHDVPRFER